MSRRKARNDQPATSTDLTLRPTAQLALRFYDPLAGSITLDGVPISDINLNSYVSLPAFRSSLHRAVALTLGFDFHPHQREQISLVAQEPTLYAGTVRFNILLGSIKPAEEIREEELLEACRSANILDFIQSLPDGFETQVGGKGAMLSGGQKQVSSPNSGGSPAVSLRRV